MTSPETPGIAAIRRAFPADKDFPPEPYRLLAVAESEASRISTLGRHMPGVLRPLMYVRGSLLGHYPQEQVDGYVDAMAARQMRLDEKLANRELHIRSIMGMTALANCPPEMAARVLSMIERGYQVSVVGRDLTDEEMGGPAIDSSIVLTGGGEGGLYVQQDPELAEVKEYFVGGFSDQQGAFFEQHHAVAQEALDPAEVVDRFRLIARGR